MIYKNYNFVKSYSNADGTQRNSMVLNELGTIIRNEPSSITMALRDAGIKVPRRATRKDLVRLIARNKRNRKLSENLAILIVANTTQSNGLLAKGMDKFDNLIDPSGSAFIGPQTEAEAMASAAAQGQGPTAQTPSERQANFFKNIGDFFRGRQERRANQGQGTATDGTAEQTNFQRFQNWFNRNRGTIGQVAGSTYDSLNRGGNVNIGNQQGNVQAPFQEATFIERNKVFVIIGVIAVLGGVIYFATRKTTK